MAMSQMKPGKSVVSKAVKSIPQSKMAVKPGKSVVQKAVKSIPKPKGNLKPGKSVSKSASPMGVRRVPLQNLAKNDPHMVGGVKGHMSYKA